MRWLMKMPFYSQTGFIVGFDIVGFDVVGFDVVGFDVGVRVGGRVGVTGFGVVGFDVGVGYQE